MIHITKGQSVPEHPELRVYSDTGDYEDTDLINCYKIGKPNSAFCGFEASYIGYGGMVYRYADVEKLGEALLAIDPNCKHKAALFFKNELIRKGKIEKGEYSLENTKTDKEEIVEPESESETETETETETDPETTPDPEPTTPDSDPIPDSDIVPHSNLNPHSDSLPDMIPVDDSIRSIKSDQIPVQKMKIDRIKLNDQVDPVSVSRYKKISANTKKIAKKKRRGFFS